jgi:hypothetical protein
MKLLNKHLSEKLTEYEEKELEHIIIATDQSYLNKWVSVMTK